MVEKGAGVLEQCVIVDVNLLCFPYPGDIESASVTFLLWVMCVGL